MVADSGNPGPLSPRYWPAWIGVGFLRILILLPYPALIALGRLIGRSAERVSRSRRRIADINLRRCFPDLSETQRNQLITRHFESLGMGFFEMAMGWWKPEKALKRLAHVHGLEHLDKARDTGRGVILLSAHFTSIDLTGRLLTMFASFNVMYRKHENPVVESLMSHSRDKLTEGAIQSENVRAMIRALKKGNVVWYASDRNTQRKQAVFVEFFGHLASTNSAASRLSKITGALVVPFYGVRRATGDGYDLFILPSLDDFPTDDIEADARRINAIIEGWVRDYPEQYLWIHRRFRTRPNRKDLPFYRS